MHWIDATLLTIFSTVACAIFPKLLSVIVNFSTQKTQKFQATSTWQKTRYGITTFPYCTSYALTGSPACKFSPHFCGRCSPN
jgi:hypothetical protein